MTNDVPLLYTTGRIATVLGEPTHRITYVIRTREIKHSAIAGKSRLFNAAAVEQIRSELIRLNSRQSVQFSVFAPAGGSLATC